MPKAFADRYQVLRGDFPSQQLVATYARHFAAQDAALSYYWKHKVTVTLYDKYASLGKFNRTTWTYSDNGFDGDVTVARKLKPGLKPA